MDKKQLEAFCETVPSELQAQVPATYLISQGNPPLHIFGDGGNETWGISSDQFYAFLASIDSGYNIPPKFRRIKKPSLRLLIIPDPPENEVWYKIAGSRRLGKLRREEMVLWIPRIVAALKEEFSDTEMEIPARLIQTH